jgi:hypothetical protein
MSTIGLAFRAFFRTFSDRGFRDVLEVLLRGEAIEVKSLQPAEPESPQAARPEPAKRAPKRSEALTLLAALQREARLVDFIQEPIGDYSDAQIGAAVRDIHRDCAALLERVFAVRPLLNQTEGATIDVPAGFDAARFSLTGNVSGQPPYRGTLAHHGWQATQCELPQWSGGDAAANVVAPAVVELA